MMGVYSVLLSVGQLAGTALAGPFALAAGQIALSVVLVLCVLFSCALGFLEFPATKWSQWATVALFLLALVVSVIQYAWTFFYLRLEDLDESVEPGAPDERGGPGDAVTPGAGRPAGSPPRLTVVEGGRRERTGG